MVIYSADKASCIIHAAALHLDRVSLSLSNTEYWQYINISWLRLKITKNTNTITSKALLNHFDHLSAKQTRPQLYRVVRGQHNKTTNLYQLCFIMLVQYAPCISCSFLPSNKLKMRDLPNGVSRGNDVPQGAFCRFICTVHCWLEYRTHFKRPPWDKNKSNFNWSCTVKIIIVRHRLISAGHWTLIYYFSCPVSIYQFSAIPAVVCPHVDAICIIKGTPIVYYKRLAAHFTK